MEQTAEQLELAEILQETLATLPCTEQDILIRYYYYQQTVWEIAEEMKIKENMVKTKLFHSRKKLRQQLTEGVMIMKKRNLYEIFSNLPAEKQNMPTLQNQTAISADAVQKRVLQELGGKLLNQNAAPFDSEE